MGKVSEMRLVRIIPTSRTFYRYRADELSGPLPPVLYKVLAERFARRLVDDGEMMWSTLAWFQNLEEAERGDAGEGRHTFFPVNGLDVNRTVRDGRPDDTRMVLPEHGFVSRAAQCHGIFIYSLTVEPTLQIGDAADRSVVEIFDPAQFVRRVRAALPWRWAEILIHDTVRYWSPANPPDAVWALPDRLTMHKRDDYAHQKEYRLAFGIWKSVFDFENVELFIADKNAPWPVSRPNEEHHRKRLRLGNLRDCCRLR
jgi:hypothetical protein